MKKHRYKISFLVTALIYVGFFLLLFDIDKKHLILFPSSTKDTISLSFSQFVSKTTLPSTNIAPIQKEQLVEEKPQPKPEKKEQLVEEKLQPKPEKIEKKELLVTKKDLRDKAFIKKKIPRSHKKTIKKSKPS
ncbi:MAG: hypothetical protein LGB62_01125, partial [Sulfurovum sp.]|nr:hypothetical protein [Sulfurovum sp.]MCB4760762.1 hypothetical protein [Sulfurovum sp.]MCB4779813.1 hypothetical protein [Sulfurovum sp.]